MAPADRVAKKRALYPSNQVMGEHDLKEGQIGKNTIEDRKLIVEPVRDPLKWFLMEGNGDR